MQWDGLINWAHGIFLILFYMVLFHRGENKQRLPKEEWSQNLSSTLVSKEVKGLRGHRICVTLKIYSNGYEKAMHIYPSRYGRVITREQFEASDAHACPEGYWLKIIYNADGSVKEEIDLMPTLNLPPLPLKPAQIPRRDYGKVVTDRRLL